MYVFLLNYFSQQSMVDVAEECISLVTNISQQRSAKALIEASAPRVISGTFAQQKKISGSIRLAYDALAPHFSQRTCGFFPSFGFGDGFFQEVCRVALFFFFSDPESSKICPYIHMPEIWYEWGTSWDRRPGNLKTFKFEERL